jgi:hypothetical protein
MDPMILALGTLIGLGLGYVIGRWNGYLDAQPKRDNKGRFKKRG